MGYLKLDEALKVIRLNGSITIQEAEKNYTKACDEANHVSGDLHSFWAYWIAKSNEIIWETCINLLRVVEKTGLDNLPDISPPSLKGCTLMDRYSPVSEWGQKIAKEAGVEPVTRPPFKIRIGCECTMCKIFGR